MKISLENRVGQLLISKSLKKEIDKFHMLVGKTEWSGILIYKHTKGNLKNLKDLIFKASHFYPMDIGTSAYTEFGYNEEYINAADQFPELIESSTGIIHTHHNMGAFFSTTDDEELADNAKNFNFYISLVVDFFGTYKAKIAIPSKGAATVEHSIKDKNGKNVKVKTKREFNDIFIGELDVIIPDMPKMETDWLVQRFKTLLNNKKKAEEKKSVNSFSRTYPKNTNSLFPQYYPNAKRQYNYYEHDPSLFRNSKSDVERIETKSDYTSKYLPHSLETSTAEEEFAFVDGEELLISIINDTDVIIPLLEGGIEESLDRIKNFTYAEKYNLATRLSKISETVNELIEYSLIESVESVQEEIKEILESSILEKEYEDELLLIKKGLNYYGDTWKI